MSDETETEERETEAEVGSPATEEGDLDEEIVVDLDSAGDYEDRIAQLEETVREQTEEIEELQDLLLDLSVRAADGRGMGVCPECHGPVVKVDPWFRSARIECKRCGEVFHEY
ncbi:hypothetical protein BRD00_03185 [Halobacteriales archaeon QS_8_69_26]|nr:MAG: hypothetical protein BRD00_03185 [Halobacteriales archaeon QS_8_69_26]